MTDTILRAVWNGSPVVLGTVFDLRRRKGEREHRAVCAVSTSRFGWEIALKINGELSHSRVCRSRDEVLGVSEQWSNALLETGWQLSEPS